MPNMKTVIRKYNSKIMKNPTQFATKTCNCRRKTDCTMDGNCLSECFNYKSSVSTTTNKYYYRTCKNIFKESYNSHICYFRNLLKRILDCPSTYENWKSEIISFWLIKILLWDCRNMFVDLESVIYAFVRRPLLQEHILMFCWWACLEMPT